MAIKKPDKSGLFQRYIFFGNALWQRQKNLPASQSEPWRSQALPARLKDSNLKIRSQSPVCYRYTIPLCIQCVFYYNR